MTTHPAAAPEDDEVAVADREQQQEKRRRKRKKKRRRAPSEEEAAALRSVLRWARRGEAAAGDGDDDEIEAEELGHPPRAGTRRRPRVAVELHAHSARSDGSLSPAALVDRAHRNGVKVLALTDHDTMAGVPEAMEAAKRHSIRVIPGVEISAVCCEEPVHILAYYGSRGPAKSQELERVLGRIREGRYTRAKAMLSKLASLDMPLKLERVCGIAGDGVAPGRVHVARAMVEAGYVESLKQAFSRYLFDGGPAYATGSEPSGESVVKLIRQTGGVAVLAHPWALKNLVPVVKDLKAAGLHAIEVYRRDGKVSGLSDLADAYELLKLGGSDYHGRDDKEEPDVGSVDLPVMAFFRFLEVAQPIWRNAIKECFANTSNKIPGLNGSKGCRLVSSGKDMCSMCLSSPDLKEADASEVEILQAELADIILTNSVCKLLIEQ